MLPEIDALIAKPDLLVALLVGALFGIVIARLSSRGRRSTWRPRNRWPHSSSNAAEARRADVADQRAADAADQLRIVMRAEFASRPLLNKGEARVFRELDRAVMARNATWQVMAQVSLGEILRSRDSEAFRCINSKRVDLLLVDADCMPRYAIEYQGEATIKARPPRVTPSRKRRCGALASAIMRSSPGKPRLRSFAAWSRS
jgi:hypothetical protein